MPLKKTKKKSSIGRKTRTDDGLEFPSNLEAECYLRIREAGLPFSLQPRFELIPKFSVGPKKFRAMHYTADFRIEMPDHAVIVEVKSERTKRIRDYALRHKLVAWRHGIVPVEIMGVAQMEELIANLQCTTP